MAQVRFTNNAKTLLNTAINNSITTVVVTDGTVLPALSGGDWFYLTLEDNLLNREIVKVTARSVNTLTVVRGQDGTTAAAWASGVKAENRLTKAALDEMAAAVAGITPGSAFLALVDDTTNGALLTTLGISAYAQTLLDDANASAFMTTLGINASVQTWLATPSSANLLTAMSDKTGTGLLVFGTSPTLTTPALGTPSALVLTNATGLPNASVIGLGTAALVNTGTSGSVIPLLSGNNIYSGSARFTSTVGPQFNSPYVGFWDAGGTRKAYIQAVAAGNLIIAAESDTVGIRLNVNGGSASVDGDPIMTRGATETITGAKVASGIWQFGSQAAQSNALLSNRGRNNAFEFGHTNTNGYGSTLGAESGTGRPFLAFNGEHGTSASTYMTRGIKASIFRSDNGGGFAWSTVASASANNQSPVDLMTLSNAGALTLTGAGVKFTATSNTSADPGYIFNVNGGRQDRIIATSTGLYIGVNVAGTERVLTLSSAGALGWAGTANIGPSGAGLLIQNTAVDYQHTIDKDNTGVYFSTNSGSRAFRWIVGGSTFMSLNTSGNLTAVDFTLSSDETLKKNFSVYTDALAKVRQLRGGEYTRISTGKREAGLMAQDFERAGLPLYVDNTTSTKTLKYPRIPALLVEAIKELADKVEALEARLA